METDPLEFELFDFDARLDAMEFMEKARCARILYTVTDVLMARNLVAPHDTVVFVGQALCGLASQLQSHGEHSDLRRVAMKAYRILNQQVDSGSLNHLMPFDMLKRLIDREYEVFEFMFPIRTYD